MKTYIIVKASSKRYHIYNGAGYLVATAPSRKKVISYLNEVFCPSLYTYYTLKYTAASGTLIATMY